MIELDSNEFTGRAMERLSEAGSVSASPLPGTARPLWTWGVV